MAFVKTWQGLIMWTRVGLNHHFHPLNLPFRARLFLGVTESGLAPALCKFNHPSLAYRIIEDNKSILHYVVVLSWPAGPPNCILFLCCDTCWFVFDHEKKMPRYLLVTFRRIRRVTRVRYWKNERVSYVLNYPCWPTNCGRLGGLHGWSWIVSAEPNDIKTHIHDLPSFYLRVCVCVKFRYNNSRLYLDFLCSHDCYLLVILLGDGWCGYFSFLTPPRD